jgi:hypothetical protein
MDLFEQIKTNRNLGISICRRLSEEIDKLGFSAAEIKHYPNYDNAGFELIKDPYTGEHNLTCYWYDELKKQRIGRLQFNSDGTFYAEYDVIKTHPGQSKWFVEGITAWGNAGNIKSEAKLLAMPVG